MLDQSIQELECGSLARIASAGSLEDLEAVRVQVLGRKGALDQFFKQMGKLPPEERARAGKLLNGAKQTLEAALESGKRQFAEAALHARLDSEWVDLTLPAPGPRRGHLHPITHIQRELEDLFISLGFTVLDGPEVETEYYNFDALNIPADHPARDMQDTFWLDGGNLLRTHTSPVQVRGMERLGPPLRMIAPGRVFRNESVDASHEHTFYQIEGMMVDRGASRDRSRLGGTTTVGRTARAATTSDACNAVPEPRRREILNCLASAVRSTNFLTVFCQGEAHQLFECRRNPLRSATSSAVQRRSSSNGWVRHQRRAGGDSVEGEGSPCSMRSRGHIPRNGRHPSSGSCLPVCKACHTRNDRTGSSSSSICIEPC
jgi:phenylalanyl-tRNA synthetase alpha subunit